MRIAIMQPYFIPYAGYFRLFSSTDLFVIYDCVQFTRRGYIHRNQLPNQNGVLSWLTLPLAKAPQDIKISELCFADDAQDRMNEQITKFPLFKQTPYKNSAFHSLITQFNLSPCNYIVQSLKLICETLSLPFNVALSSQLNLPPETKGQDRIIAIANHFKATTYINAPGGIDLYDPVEFKKQNLELKFLSAYEGSYQSILPRIFHENIVDLRHEIISQSKVL